MYLKTLYIQGFKSFANKTKIEFNNQITGIVGPNGSGKSNISDAIMWVLGETSIKSLRGSKMEDVIFSGTDKKKALGLAEVTIVFDNTDEALPLNYNEISVTRRMYRSLESEFLINNVKCRLKDIRELFMDTGIGKTGYSLIGQGKIESILSNKPEQRRMVFEEAAGISKYKMRKLSSENKLKKTQENITRLNDIISEIELREKDLKKEAQDARKYKEVFQELANFEVTLASIEIDKYIKNENKFDEKLIETESKIKKYEEETETDQKNIREIESKLEEIDTRIYEIQKSELEKNKNRERILSKINLFEEKKINFESNIDHRKSIISEIQTKLEKDDLRYNENEKFLSDLNKEYSIKKEKISILKTSLNQEISKLSEIELNIQKNNEDLFNLHKKKTDLESKIAMTKSIISEKEDRILNITKNLDILIENNKEIKSSLENISDKYSGLIENINFLKQKKEDYQIKLSNLEIDIKYFESETREYKENIDKISAKYTAYKNIAENYEGYNKSVKTFMKYTRSKKIFSDVLVGPVAENIRVDSKLEKAISVSLGGNLQNIIVEDDASVKDMIELLEKENMGRVTFLPVKNIKPTNVKINLDDFKNLRVIGFADKLIDFEDRFKNIFSNLLGKIIIVESFEYAKKLSKILDKRYRIVTIEGDSFNVGGSITGGKIYKNTTDIISRKSEIKKLSSDLNEFKKKYEESKKIYLDKKEKLENKNTEIRDLNNEISKLSSDLIILENKKANLLLSKKNNDEYLKKYSEEKENNFKSLENNKNSLENFLDSLENIQNKLDDGSLVSIDKEKLLNDLKLNIEEKRDLYSNEKIKINILENDINTKKNENISILKDKEYSLSKLEEYNNEISNYFKEIDSLSFDKEKILSEIKNIESDLHLTEINILEYRENKEKLTKELKSSREIFDKKQDEYINLEKILSKTLSEKDKIEFNISAIVDKINLEYGVSKNDIACISDYKSITELKNNISDAKEKILKLGQVNLMAIDEYKNVRERLDFNLNQKEDLIESKNEIEKIIKELEIEMKEKFSSTFNKVSKYFDEIFKILFNGGKAQIEIDEDDKLNGGIEIKAQPPGKRFQSLSLLSGGERSLTAVALLFALLKVRPAPFCILDEIDAALDDANIKRYADYLRTLSKIQFVMITHRKLTMEIANILYGVTMKEKGISKIISVKLEN